MDFPQNGPTVWRRRYGFKEWGREPKALLVGDELLDDIHMVRSL